MIYISKLQEIVLKFVDRLINEGLSFDEIIDRLDQNNYILRCNIHNGYMSKTKFEICNKDNGEYSFVDLKKRRNGKADWETIRIY